MSSSVLDQSDSRGDRKKWMDFRGFWKLNSIRSDILGVGGKGKEVLRMTHKFLAGATGWIVDNLYREGEGCGRCRLEGRKEELTFWHNK